MNTPGSLSAGSTAPAVVLRWAGGRAVPVPHATGQPLVLAFLRGWSLAQQGPAEVAAIRAQLRGLGSVLVVLSGTGAWSFRPDYDVERFCSPGDDLDQAVAGAARRYGVAAGLDAVFVIDGAGTIRFAHTAPGTLKTRLADALDAAGRAVIARQPATTFSRREWIMTSLLTGFSLAFLGGCAGGRREPVAAAPDAAAPKAVPGEMDVVLHVNGAERTVRIDPRVTLLDALRERMALPGTKKGCDHGQCGACTVLIDGRRVNACLTLALMAQGSKIVTIEGLASGDALHPVQRAFIEKDGFQCGYCTPGQIMSAVALLAEGHATTDGEVREQMSGNLCRCGAYPNIVEAIQLARREAQGA